MADTTYVFETYSSNGISLVTDDGSGIDWIIVTGSYDSFPGDPGVWVTLTYVSPLNPAVPTQAFVDTQTWNGSTLTHASLQIFGTIENVLGSSGIDDLVGSDGANVLQGDPLDVFGGADFLSGWGGADTVLGAGGSDHVQGGHGNDLLFGDSDPFAQDQGNYVSGDDSLFGGRDNDTLYGGQGRNVIDGGDGYDTADYSGFFDDFGNYTYSITCNLEAGTIEVMERETATGTETVVAQDTVSGIEVVIGTSMADTLYGRLTFAPDGFTTNTLHGLAGNDVLWGGPGADALFGGDGVDTLFDYDNFLPSQGSVDLLNGGLGNDYYDLRASTSRIIEQAGGGYDRVTVAFSYILAAEVEELWLSPLSSFARNGTGNGLDNVITGNQFANGLNGLSGADYITAEAGNDAVNGGGGDDTIFGGDGNDTLIGGAGNDELDGGAGADRACFTGAADARVNLSMTGAQITGHGTDTLIGIEHIKSDRGNDRLTGNTLANTLISGDGDDKVNGGAGNDTILGGGGNDNLRGGAGSDVFVFNTALQAGNVDMIVDFSTVSDSIHLEGKFFSGLADGRLATTAFSANLTGLAADASDRILYETDTGNLFFDADGNGAGLGIQFARISASLAVSNVDFLVF